MATSIFLAILVSFVVFAGTLLTVAAVFRWHVRRYNRSVATDLLDNWQMQLHCLRPEDRKRALLSPPASVLTAMVSLPAAGLFTDWSASPLVVDNGRADGQPGRARGGVDRADR